MIKMLLGIKFIEMPITHYNRLEMVLSDVNIVNDEGKTPMHIAVQNNLFLVVDLLLHARSALDIADKGGNTPLTIALRSHDVAIFRMLFRYYLSDYRIDEINYKMTSFGLNDLYLIRTLSIQEINARKVHEENVLQLLSKIVIPREREYIFLNPMPYHNAQIHNYLNEVLLLSRSEEQWRTNVQYVNYFGDLIQQDKSMYESSQLSV